MELLQSQANSVLRSPPPGFPLACTDWSTVDTASHINDGLDEQIDSDFPSWLLYVIAAIGMGLGCFNTFFGYKYWGVTCFLMCGYICAVVVYTLTMGYGERLGAKQDYYAYGFGLLAGVIGGLIFAKFPKFAALVAGASLGVLGALFLQPLFLAYIWAAHPNVIMYLLMGVLGALGAFLVYKMERPIVITSTSFFGAFLFIVSLSAILGNMPSLGDNDWKELAHEGIKCVPPYAWGYAGGLAGLALVGLIVQLKITAAGIDHSKPKKVPDNEQGLVVSETTPVRYV